MGATGIAVAVGCQALLQQLARKAEGLRTVLPEQAFRVAPQPAEHQRRIGALTSLDLRRRPGGQGLEIEAGGVHLAREHQLAGLFLAGRIHGQGTDVKGQRPALFIGQLGKTAHLGAFDAVGNDAIEAVKRAAAVAFRIGKVDGRRFHAPGEGTVAAAAGPVTGDALVGVEPGGQLQIRWFCRCCRQGIAVDQPVSQFGAQAADLAAVGTLFDQIPQPVRRLENLFLALAGG